MAIYFVRHGESHANEQNRFAGHHETPLTRLGIRQAQQAGERVAALGVEFDELHVSTLGRARHTAAAIAGRLAQPHVEVVEAAALTERNFGVFGGQNKSMVKKAVGFRGYTHYFHSSAGTPPGGESWSALFERVRRYYAEVLEPASRAGRNILVVTHKYVVEMFALVIAGASPQSYRDLKIPNARPLSESDLRSITSRPPSHGLVNDIGEVVEIRLPLFVAVAAVLGFLAELVLRAAVPHPLFLAGTVLLLGLSGFFGMLRLDPSLLRETGSGVLHALPLVVLRLVGALVLIGVVATPVATLVGLLLLVPSALIVPTLSLSWGGDYFSACRRTVIGSLLLPVVFFGAIQHVPGPAAAHGQIGRAEGNFLLVVCVGLLLPLVVAQVFRARAPIRSGQLSTNWSWLAGVALVPLAFFTAFSLTPRDPAVLGALPITLAIAVGVAVALRVLVSAYVRLVRLPRDIARDVVLTQTTPNIFLWIAPLSALGYGSSTLGIAACLVFFGGILVDDRFFLWCHRREQGRRR